MFNCGKNISKRSLPEQIILTAARLEYFANHLIFEPTGITSPAIKILGLLKKHGDSTPTEIMNFLGSTKSNITQRLNWLEKKDFVARHNPKNIADKRQVMISLTEKGNEKLHEIAKMMKRSEFNLEQFFSKNELDNIAKFFEKVNKIVHENHARIKK